MVGAGEGRDAQWEQDQCGELGGPGDDAQQCECAYCPKVD